MVDVTTHEKRDAAELKACPFCGGKARTTSSQVAEDAVAAWAECTQCGAQTDVFEDAYAPYEQAVSAWNTRLTAAEQAQTKLSEAIYEIANAFGSMDSAADKVEACGWRIKAAADLAESLNTSEPHAEFDAAAGRIHSREFDWGPDVGREIVVWKPGLWPRRGPPNVWYADAPAFLRALATNKMMWCRDMDLKYLNVRIDTRSGHFVLSTDRDKRIEIERVLSALKEAYEHYGILPWPEAPATPPTSEASLPEANETKEN